MKSFIAVKDLPLTLIAIKKLKKARLNLLETQIREVIASLGGMPSGPGAKYKPVSSFIFF